MSDQPEYPLVRTLSESKRLDAQHKIWIEEIGYIVHPSVSSRLTSTSRIADVGTATGFFLVDLSHQLPPTCQFHGFDVSDKQFPPSSTLPDNVTLSVQNAKLPFPSAHHGQYDLVHLRLLISAMSKDNWTTVTRNVCQLLKPGGAIQWAEPDIASGDYLRGGTSTAPDALKLVGLRFFHAFADRFNFSASDLATTYEAAGLEDIVQDVISTDRIPALRAKLTQSVFEGVFGWAYQVCDRVPGMWTRAEVDDLRAKCEEEIQGDAYLRHNIVVSVGFAKRA